MNDKWQMFEFMQLQKVCGKVPCRHGLLLVLILQKQFEFTFKVRNPSAPMKLSITESGFAGLGHCMFLSQSWAHLFCLEKPNWLSE